MMRLLFAPFGLSLTLLHFGLLHFNGPTTAWPRCTLMCREHTTLLRHHDATLDAVCVQHFSNFESNFS